MVFTYVCLYAIDIMLVFINTNAIVKDKQLMHAFLKNDFLFYCI